MNELLYVVYHSILCHYICKSGGQQTVQPVGLTYICERDLAEISLNLKILKDNFCFQEGKIESTSSEQCTVVWYALEFL